MSETMPTYEADQFDQNTGPHFMSEFAVFCRSAWIKSADQMADDLSAAGIPRSRSTCISYRNGTSEASTTLADAIYAIGEWRMDEDIANAHKRREKRRDRKRG